MRVRLALGGVFLAASAVLLIDTREAEACGCLSPPAVTEGEFAVNQRSEQIIFEVEPGWVTAHVLIKFAGDPAKFAWIVPVPEVPELGISPLTAFGLLDQMTAPSVNISSDNICPISEWECKFPQDEACFASAGGDDTGFPLSDAASFGDAPNGTPGGVTVINEQTVGDYQTVTFRASEAAAAVQWLRDNGFVVNQTTSIYMESYVNANMVFVAAKLVPGAGVSSIKPLKLKYRAAYPQVPLVLTAVAAQPHLTVTSFVYSQKPFKPQGHPVVTIDTKRLAKDHDGRVNYPQLMARQIDEAGGDGFVVEYRGYSQKPQFGGMSAQCCDGSSDFCNVGHTGQCECPRAEFDFEDCSKVSDLVDGVKLLDDLAAKYPAVTRITTRVSAEEMTFDPAFEADFGASMTGQLFLNGKQASLGNCGSQVVDQDKFQQISRTEACAATYCGAGQCVLGEAGLPGCACDAGYVAQQFVDLDGKPSVTCVPQTPPCDLRANGEVLPDACANVSCGAGTCHDRNGVAVCLCNNGAGAFVANETPFCGAIKLSSDSPGAQNYSEALRDLDVCAPPLEACEGGWYEHRTSPRPGVSCGNTTAPTQFQMIPRAGRTCNGGCGGCNTDSAGAPMIAGLWLLGVLLLRRRRK